MIKKFTLAVLSCFACLAGFAQPGQALHFDGVNDWVDVTNQPALNSIPVTLEAMIKPELRPEGNVFYPNNVLSNDVSGSYGLGFGANVFSGGSRMAIEYKSGFREIINPAGLVAGQWIHIAVVYNFGNVKTYVNGMLVDDFNYAQGALNGNTNMNIGKHNDDGGYSTRRFFKGAIDEVRVWNRALCPAEINAQYSCQLGGVGNGLVANYSFDQGTAGGSNGGVTTLNNSVSGGGSGVLNGFDYTGPTSNWIAPGGATGTCTPYLIGDINIKGNGMVVYTGTTAVNTSNYTNMGSVAPGATLTRMFTLENTGTGSLTVNGISFTGANAANFSASGITFPLTLSSGNSTTFSVNFSATPLTQYNATINIASDDCDESAYTYALQATVACPAYTASISGGTAICPGSNTGLTFSGTPNATVTYKINGGTNQTIPLDGSGSASLSVSPAVNSTYAITTAAIGSCSTAISGQSTTVTIKPQYTITVTPGSNGNISPAGNASVCQGTGISYSITPAAGYHVQNVVVDASSLGAVPSYTFSNVTAAHSISATFALDCVPAAITCPGNQTANSSAGSCGVSITYSSSATGTPTPAITYAFTGATTGSGSGDGSGSVFNKGVTTVTLTAANACGTPPTCTFTVTVTDLIPPVITSCPPNVAINTAAGLCTGATTLIPPAATDNCPDNLGNALDFDGTTSYASLSSGVYFNGNLTLEAWVYPRAFTNWSRVMDFGNGAASNNVLLAYTDGTSGKPVLYINGTQVTATSALPLNQWSHIAATLSGTTGTIYINGVSAGTATLQVPANVTRNNNYIGRSNWGTGTDPDAKAIFDEIRIWNVARTPAQIQSAMNGGLTGTETGLQVYYNMNQGTACGNNTAITQLPDLAAAGGTTNATLAGLTLSGGCTDNFTSSKTFPVAVTNNAPANFPVGNTSVTWTATDPAGNTATCMQTVTVTDNQNPAVTAAADINTTTSADGTGNCTVATAVPDAVITDNCTGSTLAWAMTGATTGTGSGQIGTYTFGKGITTITYTATDGGSLTGTDAVTVTVTDNEFPTISAPAPVTITGYCQPAPASAAVLGAPASGDNCPGAVVTNNAPVFYQPGANTVTWKITDAAGNFTTAAQTVTVTGIAITATAAVSPLYPMPGQEIQTVYLGYPGSAATETITVSSTNGVGPYTYGWSKSGCVSATGFGSGDSYGFTPTIADACSLTPGIDNITIFSIVVTDSRGCTTASPVLKKINVVNPYSGADVMVCHRNVSRGSTTMQMMTMAPAAVATHIAHGDYLGNCQQFTGAKQAAGATAAAGEVHVYPNPSTGTFKVELREIAESADIVVTDVQGKVIARRTLAKDALPVAEFDLDGFSAGMYLISVKDGELLYRTKIVLR